MIFPDVNPWFLCRQFSLLLEIYFIRNIMLNERIYYKVKESLYRAGHALKFVGG